MSTSPLRRGFNAYRKTAGGEMEKAVVFTSWGEVNKDARYCPETGRCYFDAGSVWLNYEPQSVKRIVRVVEVHR